MKKEGVDPQQLFLPDEVKFCTRCVMSNQRPRITFDEDGVCSACNFSEMKKNKFDWTKREEELIKLLDKHRRNDGRYDVIVPCSGGKDAAYIAHQLKHKYKMNPLTVTFAPSIYTDIGKKNLEKKNVRNIWGFCQKHKHKNMSPNSFPNSFQNITSRKNPQTKPIG